MPSAPLTASNTPASKVPTYPGPEGTSVARLAIAVVSSAAAGVIAPASGSPKARATIQYIDASNPQATTEVIATSARSPRRVSTPSPARNDSAMRSTRAARRSGNGLRTSRSSRSRNVPPTRRRIIPAIAAAKMAAATRATCCSSALSPITVAGPQGEDVVGGVADEHDREDITRRDLVHRAQQDVPAVGADGDPGVEKEQG